MAGKPLKTNVSTASYCTMLFTLLVTTACKAYEEIKPVPAKGVSSSSVSDTRLVNAELEPENWLSHGRTYKEQRYSTLDKINLIFPNGNTSIDDIAAQMNRPFRRHLRQNKPW